MLSNGSKLIREVIIGTQELNISYPKFEFMKKDNI